jgi:hypothetical protein
MESSAHASRPTGRGIPPIPEYLRMVVALGLGSLRNAIPAIVFLYFYRLGMGIYLAFSVPDAAPLGFTETQARTSSILAMTATYLPLLVLIYTPFLPLQDGLLRGQRRSFWDAAKHVLERMGAFILSSIAQILLLLGPPAMLIGGVSIFVRAMPHRPVELVHAVALATYLPCFAWLVVGALFLLFVTPEVVLDDRGPLRSVAESVRLIGTNLGGVVSRLFVVALLIVFVAILASMPSAILSMASAAAETDHPLIGIARAVWDSAVSALLFPFSVAALTVLYRSCVPAPGIAGAAASPAATERPVPTTPYRFE